MRLINPRERILARSVVNEHGCWIWQGSLDDDGYGYISINNRTRKVHRVSYEIFRETIPVGLVIDHNCRKRSCCNPYHLDAVTNAENMSRAIYLPRPRKTQCVNGHDYTLENTYQAPDGGYFCRTCNRLAALKYQKSRRASL